MASFDFNDGNAKDSHESGKACSSEIAARLFDIPSGKELRCTCFGRGKIIVSLVKGSAEIFGIDMKLQEECSFQDDSFAIFTWDGCQVAMSGDLSNLESWTTITDSSRHDQFPIHMNLEDLRAEAAENRNLGPRVVIVGGTDQGKSTLCRVLAAYAAKNDRSPYLVDLDVGQNSISLPGSMSAIRISKEDMSVQHGLWHNNIPLVHYFGATAPSNISYYKRHVDILSEKLYSKMLETPNSMCSGCIVNTCGWVDSPAALSVIQHIISSFRANVIVVMNNANVAKYLTQCINQYHQMLISLDNNVGVQPRSRDKRRNDREFKIRSYFQGIGPLIPNPNPNNSNVVKITVRDCLFFENANAELISVNIFDRMRHANDRSNNRNNSYPNNNKNNNQRDLKGHILAVVNRIPPNHLRNDYQLIRSSVLCFVQVIAIDLNANQMVLLTPASDIVIANKCFVIGSIQTDVIGM